MPSNKENPEPSKQLRWRAEERARRLAGSRPAPLVDGVPAQNTLHELRVHQIELEMQNEELRRNQVELDKIRARYFDLYEFAPVGYLVLSKCGQILESNLTSSTLLGTPRAALVGQPITKFILKADQDIYYRYRLDFLRQGEVRGCDLRLQKSDGTAFWAHLAVKAAEAPAQAFETAFRASPEYRAVLTDVTERKQIEAELQRSEALVRSTQQLARIGSWEWNVALQTLSWTEEVYRLLELAPGGSTPSEQALARSLECCSHEDLRALQAAFQRCLQEGVACDLQLRITTTKGRPLWIRTLAQPVLADGAIVKVTGFIMDVIDRQHQGQGGRTRKP
jgi:PAS domain S-box-containing protein